MAARKKSNKRKNRRNGGHPHVNVTINEAYDVWVAIMGVTNQIEPRLTMIGLSNIDFDTREASIWVRRITRKLRAELEDYEEERKEAEEKYAPDPEADPESDAERKKAERLAAVIAELDELADKDTISLPRLSAKSLGDTPIKPRVLDMLGDVLIDDLPGGDEDPDAEPEEEDDGDEEPPEEEQPAKKKPARPKPTPEPAKDDA